MALSERVRQRRLEKGWNAVELAHAAEISKGYLSEIESGQASRPSGGVLFRLANALGTTVADLLEKETRPATRPAHSSLHVFAERAGLPEEDVQMLAQIRFRGEQPVTPEDWAYLYESIKRSMPRRPAR